jgi:hypothetical protein
MYDLLARLILQARLTFSINHEIIIRLLVLGFCTSMTSTLRGGDLECPPLDCDIEAATLGPEIEVQYIEMRYGPSEIPGPIFVTACCSNPFPAAHDFAAENQVTWGSASDEDNYILKYWDIEINQETGEPECVLKFTQDTDADSVALKEWAWEEDLDLTEPGTYTLQAILHNPGPYSDCDTTVADDEVAATILVKVVERVPYCDQSSWLPPPTPPKVYKNVRYEDDDWTFNGTLTITGESECKSSPGGSGYAPCGSPVVVEVSFNFGNETTHTGHLDIGAKLIIYLDLGYEPSYTEWEEESYSVTTSCPANQCMRGRFEVCQAIEVTKYLGIKTHPTLDPEQIDEEWRTPLEDFDQVCCYAVK